MMYIINQEFGIKAPPPVVQQQLAQILRGSNSEQLTAEAIAAVYKRLLRAYQQQHGTRPPARIK